MDILKKTWKLGSIGPADGLDIHKRGKGVCIMYLFSFFLLGNWVQTDNIDQNKEDRLKKIWSEK